MSLARNVLSDITVSLRPGCFKLPPVCQSLEGTAEMWALTEQAHDGTRAPAPLMSSWRRAVWLA